MRCRRFKENNKNANQSLRQGANKAGEPASKKDPVEVEEWPLGRGSGSIIPLSPYIS